MVENQFREYKSELPGTSDDEKKRFLADISALANTAGGVVAYGVETRRDAEGKDTGVPIAIPGVTFPNFDAVRQRLESILRDSLSPPITFQATVAEVRLASGMSVVLIGVGRSALGPHMVVYGGTTRFFRRTQSGNYQPEMPELRRMFLEQTEWIDEALAFRDNRIDDVVSGKTYPILRGTAATLVHVIPLGRRAEVVDLRVREADLRKVFLPIHHMGLTARFNADGFVTFGQREAGKWYSYTQVFRNGAVEGFSTLFASDPEGLRGTRRLWANKLGKDLREYVPKMLGGVRRVLGVEPPYALCISLDGIKEAIIPDARESMLFGSPVDRDRLCLDPVLVEDPDSFSADALTPLLDVVWQSAGWEGVPRQG